MLTSKELGRCLQEARKRVRLSQTAVASELKVTRQVVSAYESGKRSVSAEELQLLCNLFRVFPNDLFGFTKPHDPLMTNSIDFRMNKKSESLTEHDRHEVEEFSRRIPKNADAYLARWKNSFQRFSIIVNNPFTSIQSLTDFIRKEFKQEEPPINVFLLTTHMGILLAPTHLDEPAAVVHRADEKRDPPTPPWILVNSTQPIERQRYSIAHELAHLLLHEEGQHPFYHHTNYNKRQSDRREIDADTFAAELLMPRELLQLSIGNLKENKSVEEIVFLLSYIYQVSFLAMSVRLHSLGFITRATYDHLISIKPSGLKPLVKKQNRLHIFKAEKSLPILADELVTLHKTWMYNQYAVRRFQEVAYTRYIGEETQGGLDPTALYNLESPGRVYEKVALWVSAKYPMNKIASS